MKPSVDAGALRDALEVLELKESPAGTWAWTAVRKTWGQVTLTTKRNLFSSVGLVARGAEILLRRQDLRLHHALRWGEQHLFLTAILPEGRLHWKVQAALVDLAQCRAEAGNGAIFPAVLTEKHLKWEQPEPYSINRITYVLVTPKAIALTRGKLVEVNGVNYEVQLAHVLDHWKNEYEIVRTEDL